jgi:hypothetical protein
MRSCVVFSRHVAAGQHPTQIGVNLPLASDEEERAQHCAASLRATRAGKSTS